MPSTQAHSADTDPPKFHRLFRFHDPEVVAVMAILLGLFQLLLTLLTHTVSLDMKYMFVCPLCVGSVTIIAGSFGLASERTPRRDLLKNTLISGLAGLVATLIGLFLYIYATSTSLDLPPCSPNEPCAEKLFQGFYKAVSGQLLLYDIAAVVALSFLSLSAFKGLRGH
ncbi:uncharacterized protein LOC571915 [Danio rerio]|uniref:Si:dkey-9i23.16 n=1 Tax=Danio rerio TaxID=7955 RepID=B8A643_DANRE|nr:uncharacterized protein LOC571915 [Danio rerio]|eukprot:NP_001139083.1 uncharacterized protein LOC571915 [Danio rerio]